MAQFDVYPGPDGFGFLLDCQTDLLSHLTTRFVVPRFARDDALIAAPRLNPIFEIAGVEVSMVTQFSGTYSRSDLGTAVASLDHEHIAITNALEMLVTGY